MSNETGRIFFRFYDTRIVVQILEPNRNSLDYFCVEGNRFCKVPKGGSVFDRYEWLITYLRDAKTVDIPNYESNCLFFMNLDSYEGSLSDRIKAVDRKAAVFFNSYKFTESVQDYLRVLKTEILRKKKLNAAPVLFVDKNSELLKCGKMKADFYFLIDESGFCEESSDINFWKEDALCNVMRIDINERVFNDFAVGEIRNDVKVKGILNIAVKEQENKKSESPLSIMIQKNGR